MTTKPMTAREGELINRQIVQEAAEKYRLYQAREFVRPVIEEELRAFLKKWGPTLNTEQRQSLETVLEGLASPFKMGAGDA